MEIVMTKGDTPSFVFHVKDPQDPLPNGDPGPVDLTGASIRFTVRDKPGGAELFAKHTGTGSISILNQTTDKGKCKVDLANADTASLAFPSGITDFSRARYRWSLFYDLQVFLGGKLSTPASGALVVKPEATTQTN